MEKPNILVIIPARKGSKGIKSKNKKILSGKPLVSYSLETAKALPENYHSYISTDDSEIIDIANRFNIKNNGLRPKELSIDSALTLDVLHHELKVTEKKLSIEFDGVLLLQPTCPIRNLDDIMDIEKIFIEKDMSCSVVSVKKIESEHPFRMKRLVGDNRLINFIDQGFEDMMPRQSLPSVYIRNGSIYLTPSEEIRNKRTLVTDDTFGFVMESKYSVNIDNIEDFLIAEYFIK